MFATTGLLVSLVFAAAQATSPFNAYAVFLDRATMPGACVSSDLSHLQNRSYTFRGPWGAASPLTLREGRAVELNVLGHPEWETTLEDRQPVTVGGQPADLLFILSDHVGGTGSFGTVLLVRCAGKRLQVLFEAQGEGLGKASLERDSLVVTRAVWAIDDAHCCPSQRAEERYVPNDRTRRFVLQDRRATRVPR